MTTLASTRRMILVWTLSERHHARVPSSLSRSHASPASDFAQGTAFMHAFRCERPAHPCRCLPPSFFSFPPFLFISYLIKARARYRLSPAEVEQYQEIIPDYRLFRRGIADDVRLVSRRSVQSGASCAAYATSVSAPHECFRPALRGAAQRFHHCLWLCVAE